MKVFGFLALLLVACGTQATEVSGLYDSRLVVNDQTIEVRKEAAKLGLAEVLQKVSGFALPENNPAVEKAMSIADQYLYQFSYAKVDASDLTEFVSVNASWLKMRFEERSVQRIIKAAQMPRWGSNRPTVLVWLAVDQDGRRQVVSDGVENAAANALKASAERRGLPIILPVNDLEDGMKLPIAQLWGMYSERINAASERYGAESVLAGRVYRNKNNQWQGQWKFYFQAKEFNFEFETTTLSGQSLAALTESAQILANTFALKATTADDRLLNINVSGIDNLTDYARLIAYLEKLAITQAVAVEKVSAHELTIQLKLVGSVDQFKQALALDSKLVISEIAEKANKEEVSLRSVSPILHMKWQP